MDTNLCKCIDCNEPVSKQAVTCPKCGRRWPKDGRNRYFQATKDIFIEIIGLSFVGLITCIAALLLGALVRNAPAFWLGRGVEYEFKEALLQLTFFDLFLTLVTGLISFIFLIVGFILSVYMFFKLSRLYVFLNGKRPSKLWQNNDRSEG